MTGEADDISERDVVLCECGINKDEGEMVSQMEQELFRCVVNYECRCNADTATLGSI